MDETFNTNINSDPRPWLKRSFNDPRSHIWDIKLLFAERNLEIGAPFGRSGLMV